MPTTTAPKERPMSVLDRPAVAVATATELLKAADAGQLITTPTGCTLRVNTSSFPKGTEVDAIIAGEAIATEVTLTEDGRYYARHLGWHQGPEAEWVRVERWTAEGMVFHGYIDSVSRQLLQAG